MTCDYYRILFRDIVIAEKMTLDTALLLMKALFQNYYNEPTLQYTLEKMEEEEQT